MTGGRRIETALTDWVGDAPRSVLFNDIYFSGDGVEETRHVFLAGNDLEQRFAAAARFAIGEFGFGSGLNFLVAWDLWRRTARQLNARLHFLSFEKYPFAAEALARTHRAWPQIEELSGRLVSSYPRLAAGFHQLHLAEDVTLTLAFGDVAETIRAAEGKIDAWFLDGFSPAKNPEMWTPALFAEAARLSKPRATAATFSAAGAVRRALESVGFKVEKRKGFGRKRDMLVARIDEPPKRSLRAPWHARSAAPPIDPGARIAIIGGGVAGASLAYEAAAAGFAPLIIDPVGIAAGASGNPAGLIMPRFDLGDSAAARFHLASYLHVLRVIGALERRERDDFFNPCGALLRALSADDIDRQAKIVAADLLPDGMIERREGGLFLPQAGVIDPQRFCAHLASGAPLIKARAERIRADGDNVSVALSSGETISARAVILANGRDALRFAAARTLPLSGVMGQIDHFAACAPPATAIVFGAYAAPAPSGGLVIGATFEHVVAEYAATTSVGATRENISEIARALPALAAHLDPALSAPRASVRCQTPDRLPIAGPIADWDSYGATYDDLRHGRRREYPEGRMTPGVYCLLGLGSRGLVTAPLCAALVIAEIAGAPAPIEREIAEALHPARFFIRDLKRAQTVRPN